MSIVAQDKQGKPVADLRREEFQIFDNGAPQEVRLFLAETEESDPAAPTLDTPNTFTNRIAARAGSHSGYSVILIDNLYRNHLDVAIREAMDDGRVSCTLGFYPSGDHRNSRSDLGNASARPPECRSHATGRSS